MSDDINVGAFSEALNDKMDRDAGNAASDGKEVFANSAMPSARYVDLTVGASGSQYTAPADGYFLVRATASAAGRYLELGGLLDSLVHSGGSNLDLSVFVLVPKGFTVTLYYSTNTPSTFRFIYAQGAQ